MSARSISNAIPVRVGFMPLVDCAPLVLASVLGLDKRHGVELKLTRESSWAGVRDKLLAGSLDMAQALYGLVYGVQAGIGGPQRDMAVLMGLNRNGQGISLSRRLISLGVDDLPSIAAHVRDHPGELVFAHTFPTGTHALWLYYALASVDVHPMQAVKCIVVPPPQMVTALRDGRADGVSVGAPWNHIGLAEGVSQPVLSSSDLWRDHPEKVLATTAAFADSQADTCRAVIMAVLEACRWIETSTENTMATAAVLADSRWLGAPRELIADSLFNIGGSGAMRFFDDGAVNFPWLSDAMWFVTQHWRWGLLDAMPDFRAVAERVQRIPLYREAAYQCRVATPDTVLRTSRLLDGIVWDGSDPAGYASGFAISKPACAANDDNVSHDTASITNS